MSTPPDAPRLAFVASNAPEAQELLAALKVRHDAVPLDDADVVVALGGDGFMLQTLHRFSSAGKPVYGMKAGTVGFLMNQSREDELLARIAAAHPARLRPLVMEATNEGGHVVTALAFNEVALLRQTKQAARLRIYLNGAVRLEEMVCDGVLLSTAAGSTAYNLSAHGPILPLDSKVLALTPISPFRPRRWRGAVVRDDAEVRIEVLDPYKRPVSATADFTEVRDVADVRIRQSEEITVTVLFDPEHNLEERILDEQFSY